MQPVSPHNLMFGDPGWDSSHSDARHRRLVRWLETLRSDDDVVVVELGAGLAIPTIRIMSEDFVEQRGATLIRINPREAEVPSGHIGLAMNALYAIRQINGRLDKPV